MKPVGNLRKAALRAIAVGVAMLLAAAPIAAAQSLGDLNRRLNQIEPQVSEGVGNPEAASEAINRLDQAEADFARITENGRVAQQGLLDTYNRLEAMLDRMYKTYQRQKDACISKIDSRRLHR
jgi:hypothetical protein